MKKIIILLGIPGSGKGTQARLLIDRYNYGHISTGDLLRALFKRGNLDDELANALEDVKAGRLVKSEVIYRLAFEEIEKFLEQGDGVVLDGAIRTVEQAKAYQDFFVSKGLESEVVAVEMKLDDDMSFKRLTKRKQCDSCGHIIPYSLENDKKVLCEKCSGKLVARSDDTPEIITQRIKEQGNTALAPIVDYYKEIGVLVSVDASLSIPDVDKQFVAILEQ